MGNITVSTPSIENIPNVKWLAGMVIYGKYNSINSVHRKHTKCKSTNHYALPLCTVGIVLGQGPLHITSMYGGWCAGARTITHDLYVRWVVCWGKDHYA